jgi:hypothetical protein
MRYVYLISLFTICSIITSCNSWSKGKFEITNHTSRVIDSIYILPDKSFGRNYINLKPNESKYYVTNMGGEGTDGSYLLFYKYDYTRLKQFGYYTNGAFIEKKVRIDIQPDTVLFKYEYSKY